MSKPYDATTKDLLETDPAGWVTLLGSPTRSEDARLIDADVSTVTSEADRVIEVSVPSPWLLHVELQASRDESLPWRLLRYNAILQHRHRLPVASAVVLLRPAAAASLLTGAWTTGTPLTPQWQFPYRVLKLWEQPVELILNGPPGVIPLAPLADVRMSDLPQVVSRMRERLRQADAALAARMWTATYILMGLRYNADMVDRLLAGVAEMEESATYQTILRRGVNEGYEKGRLEGRLLGLDEGRVEGRMEGQNEGRRAEVRLLLLKAGRRRFGEPTDAILQHINSIDSIEQLEALFDRVFDAASWQELLGNQ